MPFKGSYDAAPQFVQQYITTTLSKEKGYVNDPSDSGGETKYGLTIPSAEDYRDEWDKYNWDGDMKSMPIEFAKDYYTYDRWSKQKYYLVQKHSPLIAEFLFDSGVLHGNKPVNIWLQRALNVYNNMQAYYPDITVDGDIGSKTESALQSFLVKRGDMGEKVMYNQLNQLKGTFLMELAEKREKDEKFIWGWQVQRVNSVQY